MVKLTSLVRPKYVPLQMRLIALQIGPYGDFLMTSGHFLGGVFRTSSGHNFAEWVITIE